MESDLYSVSQLMPLLRMTRRQILYRVHRDGVPVQRRGRAYTVNLSELLLASMWRGLPEREKQS
jgi:hypothetical protein